MTRRTSATRAKTKMSDANEALLARTVVSLSAGASVFEAAVVGSPDRETVELVLGKDYQGVRGRSPPRPGGV